jgi:hypothetical protein
MPMKRNISTTIGCLALIAAAALYVPVAFAAAPKQPSAAPTVYINGPGVKNPKDFHITQEGLRGQIKQLERAEHMLELSAGTDRTSHSAIAAQHIRTAINELKLEAKKNAQTKHAGQSTQAAAAATPGIRR